MEYIGFLIIIVIILAIYFYLDTRNKRRINMIKLWIDHVLYTRLYMISALNGYEDTSNLLARLMQNQVEIGNMFVKYSIEQSKELTLLLQEHIRIAGDIVLS